MPDLSEGIFQTMKTGRTRLLMNVMTFHSEILFLPRRSTAGWASQSSPAGELR